MGTKTGIFYGSTLGTTEAVATQIGEKLGVGAADIHNVADSDPSGYTFDSSIALQEGRFVGLPIDENNESHLTAERIDRWTEQLKTELS